MENYFRILSSQKAKYKTVRRVCLQLLNVCLLDKNLKAIPQNKTLYERVGLLRLLMFFLASTFFNVDISFPC